MGTTAHNRKPEAAHHPSDTLRQLNIVHNHQRRLYLQRRPSLTEPGTPPMQSNVLSPTLIFCLGSLQLLAWSPNPATAAEWPFTELSRPEPPRVNQSSWCQNPIDFFILAQLESQGLSPSPVAHRQTLLRRTTVDLTGLPPSIQDQLDFQTNLAPDAYQQLLDRLLANPSYGERWGQHWLDVVRYADSDGFEYDDPRPHAWRYRDWVVQSWNQDKSIRRFFLEQIAGDELFPSSTQSLVATGLHRLGPLRLNAGMQNEEKNRQEVLTEMTDMIGAAFLGMTIGCARCHDHKFDAFSQLDYYRLQSFFASTVAHDQPLLPEQQQARLSKRQQTWQKQSDTLTDSIQSIEEKHRTRIVEASGQTNPPLDAIERSIRESPADAAAYRKLKQQMQQLLAKQPPPIPAIMAVADQKHPIPATFLLHRGEPGQHGQRVKPSFPLLLQTGNSKLKPEITPQPVAILKSNPSSGRRSALARWLVARQHPLTARVFVNRIWHHHFGQGIVTTPNDFGVMGGAASHPRLLDWLACELIENDWSAKHIHRLIMQSATYQQSSKPTELGSKRDPENQLFWRMNRKRLEAEAIRDSLLSISGQLNGQAGGPGIRLPLNAEIAALQYKGTWRPHPERSQHLRKTIYVFLKRNNRPPMLENFDAPKTTSSCGRRTESTHAGQALSLLNGQLFQQHSWLMACRLLETGTQDLDPLIDQAYRLTLARPPTAEERRLGEQFITQQERLISREAPSKGPRVDQPPAPSNVDARFALALADYCLVLLNLDEFLYVD